MSGSKAKTPPPFVEHNTLPLLFFDGVPTIGHANGVVSLCLSSVIYSPAPGGAVQTENAVVGHIRTTLAGAKMLREMLDKALLMAEPVAARSN